MDTNNGKKNAFRHTLGQAMATQEYGADKAKIAGDAHEKAPEGHYDDYTSTPVTMSFKDKDDLENNSDISSMREKFDMTVDYKNNAIGRELGAANPNASTKDLAFKTLQLLTSGKLYMAQQTINWENKTVTLQIVPTNASKQETINAVLFINKMD